jgi:hypothetical protein
MVIYSADGASAKSLLDIGFAARDKSLNESMHASMTAVCLAIMNLDESLTRE